MSAPDEPAIRAAFAQQADWCWRLGAPFTAQLCATLGERLDRSTAVGRRVLDWPGDPVADALALRIVGGLNAMVRAGRLPGLGASYPPHAVAPDFADRLIAATADDGLLPWLDSPPQTNEVGRSAVLMPGLLVVAAETGLSLRLFELGTSAGLNLRLDDYAYDLGGTVAGRPDSGVRLVPGWAGKTPPPNVAVSVASRAGVDRAPVNVTRDGNRLLAYVWPDQPDRVARLEAAIAAFIADPVEVAKADAADWVEAIALEPGTATVVFHSIAFQYFAAASQARIAAHLAMLGTAATAANPLAWLRFEFESSDGTLPTLRLTSWPGGDDRLLARAHPHGASVEWLA